MLGRVSFGKQSVSLLENHFFTKRYHAGSLIVRQALERLNFAEAFAVHCHDILL